MLYSLIVCSQEKRTICGYIRQSDGGEAISGANVYCQQGGTTSNEKGFYILKFETDTAILHVSFIGFNSVSQKITTKQDTIVDIYLTSQYIELEEVAVQNTMPFVKFGNAGKIDVNTSQLKYFPSLLGEQDIFKYLQIFPGISPGKEGASGLNIRGNSSDATLMFLDDMPLYNQNHAFGFVSIFNGDGLISAEAYKGYIPGDYGGRLGGVASFRLKEGNKHKHHQSIALSTISASLVLEGPIKKEKSSYYVSARRFIPDLFLRGYYWAIGKENNTQTLYSFFDVTGKMNFKIDNKNSLSWSIYAGNDKINILTDDVVVYAGLGKIKQSKTKSEIGWGNLASSLRLNTIVNKNIFMHSMLFFSTYASNKENRYKNYQTADKTKSFEKMNLIEFGLKTGFDHKISTNHLLKYGLQLLAFSTQPKKIGYRRNEIKNEEQAKLQHFYSFVFYVGDQFRLKDWNIDMNVRMSVYDNRNRKIVCIEPRIKTEYAIDSYNTTWIGIGVNNQPLFSLKKYYLGGLPIDSWVPFKNSQIQKSVQYFAGWKNTYLNRFTFSVDAYYKKMSDLVLIFDSEEYLNNFGGYNSASGYSYGGELMVEYLGKYVNILASYTYSRSTRKIEEKRFNYPFDTPHDLNLFGKIATVNKKESKQYFSFNLNYHTGLPYMLANGVYSKLEGDGNLYPFYPESEIMDNPQYPNTRLTDYFRLDIGYNIEKKKRKGSSVWQFSLINLTNTHNPYMIYRHKDKYKSIAIFPFMPSISFKRNF